jgi:hypothetical protein
VTEGVRRIVMGKINDTARRLLREMGRLAEDKPSDSEATAVVVPREAAENLDLDPEAPEYDAALNHLLALGDIERISDSGAPQATEGLYRLTNDGLRRAREIRWGFMW